MVFDCRTLVRAVKTHRSKAFASNRGTIPPIYLTELSNRHAASDERFCADDGTPTVWLYRHIDTNGKRRVFSNLLHGTMAAPLPMLLGLQKCHAAGAVRRRVCDDPRKFIGLAGLRGAQKVRCKIGGRLRAMGAGEPCRYRCGGLLGPSQRRGL